MDSKKLRTSLLAVAGAAAIALSGTFAWQSISQDALGVLEPPPNPGGRLHDDFNGYKDGCTKDIYVENFGNQVIYARVRLDEYMEIGMGAGLKPDDPDFATKNVTKLKGNVDAQIEDPTTWATHKPGATPADPASTTEDEFHTYWTWVMGGQTVYMPTFDRNHDSLQADINGSFQGTVAGDDLHYDDYYPYFEGETKTADEILDADDNAIDEGAAGVEGTNYTLQNATHTAKRTESGTVITMEAYKKLTDAQKETLNAWVYDADGWAYWSQPIPPDSATGLLLDQIVLDRDPAAAWYYAINAVAQFITADDLGRANATGFYDPTGGAAPSDDAVALLDFIGVNTAAVDGSITLSATTGAGADVQTVTAVVPGLSVDLAAVVDVPGVSDGGGTVDQSVTWTLTGNTSTGTKINTASGTPVLTVDASEPEGNTLRLVATSTAYDGLKGRLSLKVGSPTYTADITNWVDSSVKDTTVTLVAGAEGAVYTASATSSPAGFDLGGTWTWTSSNTSAATLSADTGETVTVTAPSGASAGLTSTITATNGSVSASFLVKTADKSVTINGTTLTAGDLTNTVTIDDIEWVVLTKGVVEGKAAGESTATSHNAALLLSKNILEARQFDDSSPLWSDSTCEMRTYLNSTETDGWSNGKTNIQSKAIEVNIQTRNAYNSTTSDGGVDNKVFLLSEADVFGTSNYGADKSPQSWEYIYSGVKLACFTDNASRIANLNGSASSWWLRSPAYNANYVANIVSNGTVDYARTNYDGVRPAFWYNLDA